MQCRNERQQNSMHNKQRESKETTQIICKTILSAVAITLPKQEEIKNGD